MRSVIVGFVGIVVMAIIGVANADTGSPESKPASYSLSEMRFTQLKPCSFMYMSSKTTYADAHQVITTLLASERETLKSVGIVPNNGPVLVYVDPTQDPSRPVTLEVGFPVPDDTQPIDGLSLRKLGNTLSATILYTGPVNQSMSQAISDIYAKIFAAGHAPSGPVSLRHLYWESEGSANNVVLVEIALSR